MNSIDWSISRGYEYTWWFSCGILIKSCTIFVKDNKKSFSVIFTNYLTYFVQVNENDNFYILPNIISCYILLDSAIMLHLGMVGQDEYVYIYV